MALPGFGDINEKYETLCTKLDALTQAIQSAHQSDQLHSKQLREWEPFRHYDQVALSNVGAGTLQLQPARAGWEARVCRVSVSVTGASGATVVAVYVSGQDETMLLDISAGLQGASPSRTVADYNQPLYFTNAEAMLVAFTGAAASASANVRIEGFRREV
jgi:hypothetical protein